jgi:hypothetical protein
MANDRYNVRIDGSLFSRLLINLIGGTVALAVQGLDADDDPATARPVLVGGKYIADPTADTLDDGDAGYILLDDQRRVVVVGTLQGVDADDAAATVNPVLVGGKYIADPTADTLDDGDAGYALLNLLRMIMIEDRVYDSATDANKNVPVWSVADLYDPEDLSGSTGANGTTTYYVSMDSFIRWSLQFIPSTSGTSTFALTVAQSNEDVDDPSTATYLDVTNTFFGVASFTTSAWIEPENPTSCKWLRIQVTVDNYGTDALWDLFCRKLAQG